MVRFLLYEVQLRRLLHCNICTLHICLTFDLVKEKLMV